MRTSTVTRKGQVTIPIEIRDALGITEGDIVEFTIGEDESVTLTPRRAGVFAQTAGIFKSYAARQPVRSAEELRRWAEEMVAEDAMRQPGAE